MTQPWDHDAARIDRAGPQVRPSSEPCVILRATADGVRDGRLVVYAGASHASAMTDKRSGDDVASFLGAAEAPAGTDAAAKTVGASR